MGKRRWEITDLTEGTVFCLDVDEEGMRDYMTAHCEGHTLEFRACDQGPSLAELLGLTL